MGPRVFRGSESQQRGLAGLSRRPEAGVPPSHISSQTILSRGPGPGIGRPVQPGRWRLNQLLARPRTPGHHRRWVLVPAFLFPKNGQATGMSRTLCQGALKPPASPAPRLVTWSRAKAGPQALSGVGWSSWQRGEWNPTEP